MHLIRIKMVQLLIGWVARDDGESPWADPNPEVFLKFLRCVEGPYLVACNIHKVEAGVLVVTVSRF